MLIRGLNKFSNPWSLSLLIVPLTLLIGGLTTQRASSDRFVGRMVTIAGKY